MKQIRLLLLTLGLLLVLLHCGSDDNNGDTTGDTTNVAVQLASGRVMWIGAHPDDEVIVSPLLGDICVERGGSCTFLVTTRGEAGLCGLLEGCQPDLATVRTHEMQEAATLFGATLVHWDLPDGSGPTPEAVLSAWANSAGGEEALLDRIATAIDAAAPDSIITFDPRHGTTCHVDHRALATLTLAAVERLNIRPPTVYLAEQRIEFSQDRSSVTFSAAVPGDTSIVEYDATQQLAHLNGSAWGYLLLNVQAHPSQFDTQLLNAVTAVPPSARRVFLLPLAGTNVPPDSRYDNLCNP